MKRSASLPTHNTHGHRGSRERATPTASRKASEQPSDAARRKRDERECAQFLRAQQKLVGKKTTDEYARLRLIQRQDDAARKRNLHQNGPRKTDRDSQTDSAAPLPKPDSWCVRPQSARGTEQRRTENKTARPQSAKPVRQSGAQATDRGVAGHRISVALLERCFYNPIPLTTHLAASHSAPRLETALHSSSRPTQSNPRMTKETDIQDESTQRSTDDRDQVTGRRHIVVYMQRVEIQDESEDELSPSGQETAVTKGFCSSPPGQRHDRARHSNAPIPSVRSAWGE